MKRTIELTETNFDEVVRQTHVPLVVDFWAEWCGPCKMLAPILDEIASEQGGRAVVAKVNVDEQPALAARFGIQGIPTLLYFSGGELRARTVGAVGRKTIEAKLETLHAASTTAAAQS